MSRIELKPQDERMLNYWQVQTEFLLNRIAPSDIKRMVDDVNDSISFGINKDGEIVEKNYSPIKREKESVSKELKERYEEAKEPKKIIEDNLSELKENVKLPGQNNQKRKGKIEALEEVLEEIENE